MESLFSVALVGLHDSFSHFYALAHMISYSWV